MVSHSCCPLHSPRWTNELHAEESGASVPPSIQEADTREAYTDARRSRRPIGDQEAGGNDPVTVYVDGAYSHGRDLGGCGVVVVNGDSVNTAFYYEPDAGSNQRAEILAAIRGVSYARRLHNPYELLLISDSQYVVYTMTLGWRRAANRDLWLQLDTLVKGNCKVRMEWVPRNSDKYMTMADKLAKEVTYA